MADPPVWAYSVTIALLLIVPYIDACKNRVLKCSEVQYYKDDSILSICCNKCPEGSKVERDCTFKPDDGTCTSCPEGFFSSGLNGRKSCIQRDYCSKAHEMIAVAARNSSEDNKCKCIKGYHYSQSREACIKNPYCPPGEGIKKSTGECVVCEAGTYSDINSNTQKCKQQPKCDDFKEPGNTTHKRICNSDDGIGDDYDNDDDNVDDFTTVDTTDITATPSTSPSTVSSSEKNSTLDNPKSALQTKDKVIIASVIIGIFVILVCVFIIIRKKKKPTSQRKPTEPVDSDVEEGPVNSPQSTHDIEIDEGTETSSERTTSIPLLSQHLSGSSSSGFSEFQELGMKEKDKQRLRRLMPQIKEDLPYQPVLDEMTDVFTSADESTIKRELLSDHDRRGCLIDILITKGPNAFVRFVETLEKINCTHLANALKHAKQ